MCGISGFIGAAPEQRSFELIDRMLEPIRSRGPDDEGVCLADRRGGAVRQCRTDKTRAEGVGDRPHYRAESGVFSHDLTLIHTRYSIIDLSAGGHQPFVSGDGRCVAIFNGEIYNYRELRMELEASGVVLRTSSDTEALVEGYCLWGDELWAKMNGFWAVALLDRRDGSVTLSRDRIGVAPLYYRETPVGFFFSSSIRSLVVVDPHSVHVDQDATLGFIETSQKDFNGRTCFEEIKALPPAAVLRFPAGASALSTAELTAFWQLPAERLSAADLPFDEAVRRFHDTFVDAVDLRLRADVKVAFELSGGLDSSSIVGVAASLRDEPVTTYTIEVPEENEEPYARAILERHSVDYRVLRDPEDTFFRDLEGFTDAMQEPYHSPNIYTHYKMRTLMKGEGVHAVLSGSGGDEVLAGYEARFWKRAAAELRATGRGFSAKRYEWGKHLRPVVLGRTLRGLPRRMARIPVHGYRAWRDRSKPLPPAARGFADHAASGRSRAAALLRGYPDLGFHEQQRYHFTVGLLPYYLRSNDHFTMAIPLEHRFPFLDYRVVELGLQMPITYLFHNGWTKYLLRKAMEPYLPKKILWRVGKMGFPFALPRFLNANRTRLEPYAELVRERGLDDFAAGAYPSMLAADPMRLWRTCSTGMWLSRSPA